MPRSSVKASMVPVLIALGFTFCVATNSSASQRKKATERTYQDYQVAAGTHVPIELRTRLSSNTAQPGDPVDGRLVRAVTADGIELIPSGSMVLGTVSEAAPAGKKKPGRLVFTFHFIEHPDTVSRATIRTTVLVFASDRPEKGNVFPELLLEKGADVSASLLAPLTVRIPVKPAVQPPRSF